jgi:hypothetical protein
MVDERRIQEMSDRILAVFRVGTKPEEVIVCLGCILRGLARGMKTSVPELLDILKENDATATALQKAEETH